MPDLLTIEEAAAVARCSTKTIRRAIHDRHRPLRAYRPGRVMITSADLDAWIKSRTVSPKPSAAVVDRLSPAARELLDDLREAGVAPQRHQRGGAQGQGSAKPGVCGSRPSDYDSDTCADTATGVADA